MSMFNAPKSTASTFGFGNTGFGQPSTGFGQPSTGFGQTSTGFGQTSTGFGQTSTGFGQPSTGFGQSSTGFGQASTGFGQASTGFGQTSTGFGQTSTGFGQTSTGFGQPSTGFGTQPTSTGISFGSFSQPASTGPISFGTTTPTTGGIFGPKPTLSSGFNLSGGSLFNAPKTTTSSSFGFGTNNTFKGFGQTSTQQPFQNTFQQPQQQPVDPNVALYLAVCAPTYFNDERDEVLKKWNQIQAVWGSGKGYYAQNMPPVDFQPDNPFCRFKAVGYIKLPTYTPEDGFVEVTMSLKESDVRNHQQQIVDSLVKLFEGCQVCVDYVQPFGDAKTRMCIYVQQRNPNGETKKFQAWMVYNHLTSQNQNIKQTLTSLCVENVTPLVSLTESQLKEYLENPPQGIDPMIWEQGKRANPNIKLYLPVPMVGFQELKARFKAQEEEARLLQGQLDSVADEITHLQGKQSKLVSDLQECKRRQLLMSHRVLKLVVKQEINRKRGVPIEQGEEHLRMLLEALHSQLASPTQYMGRLNELLSQISVQPGVCPGTGYTRQSEQRYTLDSESEKDLLQFLSWEQDAIKEVVAVIKKDTEIADKLLSNENK